MRVGGREGGKGTLEEGGRPEKEREGMRGRVKQEEGGRGSVKQGRK